MGKPYILFMTSTVNMCGILSSFKQSGILIVANCMHLPYYCQWECDVTAGSSAHASSTSPKAVLKITSDDRYNWNEIIELKMGLNVPLQLYSKTYHVFSHFN